VWTVPRPPDEDFLTKPIKRKAASNLDTSGNISSVNSFLAYSTPQILARLNNVGVSMGNSFELISISTKALKHMEYDKLKCTPMYKSKSDTSLTIDDDDEAHTILDG
jgi:hypothetical protein